MSSRVRIFVYRVFKVDPPAIYFWGQTPVEFPPPSPDRCSLVYSTIFSNYRAMLCIARRMLSQYVCPSVRPTVRHTPLLCWNSKFRRLLRCAMRGACALRDAYGVIRRNTAYYCRMHMAYLRHASCMQDAMHHACRMQCIVVWTQHNRQADGRSDILRQHSPCYAYHRAVKK